jgi:hypothetical protein
LAVKPAFLTISFLEPRFTEEAHPIRWYVQISQNLQTGERYDSAAFVLKMSTNAISNRISLVPVIER